LTHFTGSCRAAAALLLVLCGLVCACARTPVDRPTPVVLEAGLGLDISARPVSLPAFLQNFYTEPLVTVAWEGRITPRLVDSLEWLDGNRRLKLHVRPGVRFHDGTPLTAPAIVDVLRGQMKQGAIDPQLVTGLANEDDQTVVITLARPDAFFLEHLSAIPIVPAAHPQTGTGPFRLVRAPAPAQLAAFDDYYRGRPPIDQIRVHPYDSQRAAWAAMLRGEVDYLHDVSREAADFVEAQSTVTSHAYLAPYYIALVFNMHHPVLGHVEVRRALNQAIDREKIIAQAMHGRATRADGPIWPQFWAVSSAQRTYSFNPEAAGIRLDAAGFPIRRDADPSHMARRFKFTCLYWSDGPQYERIALILQKQLFDIGVDVEMEPVPLDRLYQRMARGDYDAFMLQMSSGRALSWTSTFWDSRNRAQAGFTNYYSSADSVLERLRLATSEDQTRDGVAELQRVLFDDPPAAFLVWLMSARAVSAKFDVRPQPNRDILANIWQWQLAPPNVQAAR
jgi:peptide/nickel transport system substrate-binding protein